MPVWLVPVFLFIGYLLGWIREFHHVGLKDAKDIIDAMERNLVTGEGERWCT